MGYIESENIDTKRCLFYNLIVEQIEFELASQIKYYNISQVFDNMGMKNLTKFFLQQAAEENEHAQKFMKFLSDSGVFYQIGTVRVPKVDVGHQSNLVDQCQKCLDLALTQEMEVTAKIHVLFDVAKENKYFEAESLFSWFTEEQMEEEDTMRSLRDLFNLGEKNLLLLDNSDYVRELLVVAE